jgi:hypothetical protein
MATPEVDFSQVSLLTELVLRGGDVHDPRAREILQEQYTRVNRSYPDLSVGLSCLFRPGASFDELAHEGSYPNARLSVTITQRLHDELAAIGCELALYITPVPRFPDHHTLVVKRLGGVETTLRDEVLDALIRAMITVSNPYRQRKY